MTILPEEVIKLYLETIGMSADELQEYLALLAKKTELSRREKNRLAELADRMVLK